MSRKRHRDMLSESGPEMIRWGRVSQPTSIPVASVDCLAKCRFNWPFPTTRTRLMMIRWHWMGSFTNRLSSSSARAIQDPTTLLLSIYLRTGGDDTNCLTHVIIPESFLLSFYLSTTVACLVSWWVDIVQICCGLTANIVCGSQKQLYLKEKSFANKSLVICRYTYSILGKHANFNEEGFSQYFGQRWW